jgi:ABC-type transporter Mla subunit MlaD
MPHGAVDSQMFGSLAAHAEAETVRRWVVDRLAEGLKALREDLSRAITAVHSGTMAEKVESLSHELEMIHSTLATLKDLAAQQRDHLRTAQDLLATRAKQGVVEIELTQEMMSNERAFLEKFHEVLQQKEESGTTPSAPTPPPPLPPSGPLPGQGGER